MCVHVCMHVYVCVDGRRRERDVWRGEVVLSL